MWAVPGSASLVTFKVVRACLLKINFVGLSLTECILARTFSSIQIDQRKAINSIRMIMKIDKQWEC